MREVTLEELLEAGCHFGHQVTRQNTKARDFIFEARDNIHIIDLAKTKEGLDEAASYIRDLAAKPGSSLIIVGSKRQAQQLVAAEFKRVAEELGNTEGLFTVTNRWIGGTLTNFSEVAKNYKKLAETKVLLSSEEKRSKYTKKELGQFDKGKQKLEVFYGGVANIQKLPDALFIIDTNLEDLAVKEARAMGIPTVGIVDTNADPTIIDHPIPANDDAIGSVELLLHHIVDAWIEGRRDGIKSEELRVKNEAKQAEVASEEKTEAPKEKKVSKVKKATKKKKE